MSSQPEEETQAELVKINDLCVGVRVGDDDDDDDWRIGCKAEEGSRTSSAALSFTPMAATSCLTSGEWFSMPWRPYINADRLQQHSLFESEKR